MTKKKQAQQQALIPQVLAPPAPADLSDSLVTGLNTADWYVEIVEGYDIPDDVELAAAKELAKKVHAEIKAWEAAREAATRKLKDEYDARRELFNPVLERLKKAKETLKDAVGRYQLLRIQQQRELMAQAAAAETPTDAIEGMRHARQSAPEEVSGVTVATAWKAHLVDAEQVPEVYRKWYIDMDEVQAAVDGGAREIPGIEIVEVPVVTVRKGK